MKYILPLLFLVSLSTCYTFRDITIPPEVNTFRVDLFDDRTIEQVPGLAQTFSQSLRDRIRNESRLKEVSAQAAPPDVEFSGFISKWEVNSIAPTANATSALTQLKIYIKVAAKYKEDKFKIDEFDQTFNSAVEFSADQNLIDVQDEFIEQIFEQITTEVFNKAFTKW